MKEFKSDDFYCSLLSTAEGEREDGAQKGIVGKFKIVTVEKIQNNN